ncbi:MAG: glycoside hydrolase family 2 protein [Planctomycetota bacterium]
MTVRCAGDSRQLRIGLRRLELVRGPDAVGESCGFRVNGLSFFAKGANWIPENVLPGRIDPTAIHRLLDDAAAAHMNMLRVWGGGLYEVDAFYERCDELGILVWQDCAFACGEYPWDDAGFQASVQAEIADNVRRLRHHPSLALWCGNNEIEMGKVLYTPDYDHFMDAQLPAWIAAHDPDTPYWPSSPHSPGDRAWASKDSCGDAHHWDVFFGGRPIEHQRNWRCRFMSEYGFQSLPDRRTVAAFTEVGDRGINTPIMDYHQRSQVGNRTMLSYVLDWLPAPTGFEQTIYATQLVQALCLRYAAEHLRRLQPHSQGCLYWQINDVWPCPSWSTIDHGGRWKVAHYDMVRAFAPILVSLVEDQRPDRVAVHCSNQTATDGVFTVRWAIGDTDGSVLAEGSEAVLVPCQSDRLVTRLDLQAWQDRRHRNDLLVWAWVLDAQDQVCSRNLVSCCRPKHLSLADPGISASVGGDASGIWVDLSCRRPALWVGLDLEQADTLWSDNHIHLHPDEPRRIHLRRGPDRDTVQQQLRVTSLSDLMPHRRPLESRCSAPSPDRVAWYKLP